LRNETTVYPGVCDEYACKEPTSVAWSLRRKKADTCATQTLLKGVAFNSWMNKSNQTTSQEACCEFALSRWRMTRWSFNLKTSTCTVHLAPQEQIARHMDPDSISGEGFSVNDGLCQIFSSVTGIEDYGGNDDAISASSTAKIHLYPSWPASSPWVTSVGATRFVDQKVGQPEMATDRFGSGGGFSDLFDAFDEQKGSINKYFSVATQLPPDGSFTKSGRATPDVSGLGEGYQVVKDGSIMPIGGTSASTPMFAGLVSLLNEARIKNGQPAMGYLNPWIYKNAAAFTDVTRGDNFIGRVFDHGNNPNEQSPYGFNCTDGWDPTTGVGTPLFDKMLTAATAERFVVV